MRRDRIRRLEARLVPSGIDCVYWNNADIEDPRGKKIHCHYLDRDISVIECPGFNGLSCEHASRFIKVNWRRIDSKGNVIEK